MKKLLLALGGLVIGLMAAQSALAQDVKGNPNDGAKKVAQCIGCHGISGYHSSFPEVYRVPMIAGQSDSYIVAALVAYRNGERKHPTMRGTAVGLSDQDMADVAAHYAALGGNGAASDARVLSGDVAANALKLVERGGCKSCHGEDFSKPIAPGYPKIAGQHADYLLMALTSYKMDSSPVMGRSNPVMGGIAKQFSNDELKLLAKYVGALPGQLKTVPQSKFK